MLTEAVRKGLTVRQSFFTASAASDIRTEHGAADAIVAANVVCHVADIHSLFAGVRRLLRPSGLFIFEDPHVGAILDQSAVDQIYDEHVFYFHKRSSSSAFRFWQTPCCSVTLAAVALTPVDGASRRVMSRDNITTPKRSADVSLP